jgi:hypothetical protein
LIAPKITGMFIILPYFVIVFMIWKNTELIAYMLLMYICIVILLDSVLYITPLRYKMLILICVILFTYIIPEFAHYYFDEPTYLYNRISRESTSSTAVYELILHVFNIVPYCFINVL